LYVSTKLRWIKQGKGINNLNPSLGFQQNYSRKQGYNETITNIIENSLKYTNKKHLNLKITLTIQVTMHEETLVS
jgi:hypothetical protein